MNYLRSAAKALTVALALAGCAAQPAPRRDAGAAAVRPSEQLVLDGGRSCHIPGFKDAFVRQLRAARASAQRCGTDVLPAAHPLAWNDELFTAAAHHSADMARRDYFEHVSPEGSRVGQRVSAAGYPWRGVAENIAAGDKSVDRVMAGWMRSAGHCRNIMEPQYTDVAVACVERRDSHWGTYWTMVLGRKR